MIVSNTAVKNRVSVIILAIIILFAGIYCYDALPKEAEPDITIPFVFVSTDYKGVAAADIETSITIPIEKKMKGLDGVKNIRSVSSEGRSSIEIEFVPSTDIDKALQKVKDKVDEVQRDLPRDLENDPAVFEVNFSELPIIVYSLSGTCGLTALKRIADGLEEDIESIPGILEVNVTGGREREIVIEVDPDKLAYYKIPITAFQSVVAGENSNTSGGAITLGDGRFQLRVPGEFKNPDEIYFLVVQTFQGRPVYLKDVARVTDSYKEEASRSRLNGREAVNISVKKRSGENVITIVDTIEALIEAQQPAWPAGTEITKLMNSAKQIRQILADLENNILSGLVLVVVVLFFALGLRNATLVGLAIPFSMLLSFMVLYAIGINMNMVVLFGLTLALGMMVDNAIVIVENIYRFMEQGVPRVEAAMKATSEVAYPVIGSTLTTVAAFFPLIFWPGIMGEFMVFMPKTLIVTLLSSLFVAMVINPALAAIFMKVKIRKLSPAGEARFGDVSSLREEPIAIKGVILKTYARMLDYALHHRAKVVVLSFSSLIIFLQIWMLVIGIEKPVEFFPTSDPSSLYVNADTPEGSGLEYNDNIIRTIEFNINNILSSKNPDRLIPSENEYVGSYELQQHDDVTGETFLGPTDIDNIEHIYATSKTATGGMKYSSSSANHLGVQFIDFEKRLSPAAEAVEAVRERIESIPGARITVVEQRRGPPTGKAINIEISGEEYHILGELAAQVRGMISKIPYVEDVQDDYTAALPSVKINIDRQKAALFGLSTNSLGYALKTAYNGMTISTYREGGEDFDITVKLSQEDREAADVLHRLMIPAPDGKLVPLTTLASISYSGSKGDITRMNHNRVVTVSANADETKIPGATVRLQAEELLNQYDLPQGYQITFTGENEEQEDAQAFLSNAFLIAVFLIFLILVTIFNSVSQPLIIMTSVVLSFGGVFLGLTVMKFPIGVIMTGLGVISLAGVVVNNAIVLIDYTNKLRQGGFDLHDAIKAAGATRLRPVMLTAITTILGLLPMVTGVSFNFRTMSISWVSEGSQMWQSMSIVVIFGLLVATFLTLLVVPTLYSILATIPGWLKVKYSGIKTWYWKPFERSS